MAKYIFLSFLFIMIYFFSNAQENKSGYGFPQKNWVKTKPIIIFCGKESGEIPLDSISLESIISVNSPYSFHSLSIVFGGAGFVSPILVGYGSSSKDKITFYKLSSFKELLKKCRAGTKIGLTNIQVIKDRTIYDAPDVTYTVK
jgi:hypothetical protein